MRISDWSSDVCSSDLHHPDGKFDIPALVAKANAWSGLLGLDLAKEVSCSQSYSWGETGWVWGKGYGELTSPKYRVVAVDYGIKRNILRGLAGVGCDVTVVPANTTAEDILALKPDGIFLSNRSEEHTSELQSLMRISYAVFCLNKKK